MGFDIFRKFRRNDNVIDMSVLHKKGIIQSREKKETADLTGSSANAESSPLGFLGSLAGSAENSKPVSSVINEPDGNARLTGVLRDMKGKIDSTYNRTYKLSDRIDLLEKKLERLERRAGVSSD